MDREGILKFNPVWLIYLAIVLCGGMALMLTRLELPDPSTSTMEGETMVLHYAWWTTLVFVVPALAGCLIAGALWLRGGVVPRVIAVFVACLVIFGLVEVIAMRFVQRAELTDDEFRMRLGSWHRPVDHSLKFADVFAANIVPDYDTPSEFSRHFVLECDLKPLRSYQTVRLPINDFVKSALRQILERLRDHDVIMGDPIGGFAVPKELKRWAP